MSSQPSIDLPAETEDIEVLWILQDDSSYWWHAIVIDIEECQKGSTLAKGILRYDPGPDHDDFSLQKVKFLSDHTVTSSPKIRSQPSICNTWRYPPSSVTIDSEESVDVNYHSPQQTKNNQCSINNSEKKRASGCLGKSTSQISNLQVQVSNLEKALDISLDKLVKLEAKVEHLQPLNSIIPTFLISDLKNFIRRALITKLTTAYKRCISNSSSSERGQENGLIFVKVDCSLHMFQIFVEDMIKHNGEVTGVRLNDIQYIPSKLSILHPSLSVPSYNVYFRNFRQICDFLNIRDLNDREQCISKISTARNSQDLVLRVLGTMVYSIANDLTFYIIGSDATLPSKLSASTIIYRTSSHWDSENDHFSSSASALPTVKLCEVTANTQNSFSFSWKRMDDMRSQKLTPDVTRNPNLQLGNLYVSIPVIYFSGKTALEIDSLLSLKLTTDALFTESTSAPQEL